MGFAILVLWKCVTAQYSTLSRRKKCRHVRRVWKGIFLIVEWEKSFDIRYCERVYFHFFYTSSRDSTTRFLSVCVCIQQRGLIKITPPYRVNKFPSHPSIYMYTHNSASNFFGIIFRRKKSFLFSSFKRELRGAHQLTEYNFQLKISFCVAHVLCEGRGEEIFQILWEVTCQGINHEFPHLQITKSFYWRYHTFPIRFQQWNYYISLLLHVWDLFKRPISIWKLAFLSHNQSMTIPYCKVRSSFEYPC